MSFDANSLELRDSGRVAELALKLGRPYSRLTAVNWCMVQDHLLSFGPHRSLTGFTKSNQSILTQKILGQHFKVFNFHILWGIQYCHLDTQIRSFFFYEGMMKPMKLCMTAAMMHSCHHLRLSARLGKTKWKQGFSNFLKARSPKYCMMFNCRRPTF